MILDAGCPIALSSDAHVPEQLGFRYEQALELLEELGVQRAGRLRAPAAADGADRLMARTGIGIDSHAFAPRPQADPRRRRDPARPGLQGHSDADVLAHAITDALLGAAGLGDIGQHFPDTDERWRDADSMELLRVVAARVGAIEHVDAR